MRSLRKSRRIALATTIALVAPLATASVAQAATVYELSGIWAAGTTATVESGDPLASVWWFNLNDDAAAPGNAHVDNLTVVFQAQHARFVDLPPTCLEGSTPPSAISDDRTTLTCNLGTRIEGSAEIMLTGLVAHGPVDSWVTVEATVGGAGYTLPELLITGDFAMDLKIDQGSPEVGFTDGGRRLSVPWSLRHKPGTESGPSSVSYHVEFLFADNSIVASTPTAGGVQIEGCVPQDRKQVGHPYSAAGHPAGQTARFPTCELVDLGANTFELTISGLDYAVASPASDSTGVALPSDWNVIAAGEFRVQFPVAADGSTVTAQVTPITYVSTPSGLTSNDDPANNSSAATVLLGNWFGGWTLDWMLDPGIGYPWSDTFRTLAGTEVLAASSTAVPPTGSVVICSVYDSRYVEFEVAALGKLQSDSDVPLSHPGVAYEYYVGDGPGGVLDPDDDDHYDPNAFRCGDPDPAWTTVLPSDPANEVKAVRATSSPATHEAAGGYPYLVLFSLLRIRSDVADDQDVWVWTSFSDDGGATWVEDHRGDTFDPAVWPAATATPGLRYGFAYAGRDVLRIVPVLPVVSKSVDQEIEVPGGTVDYTIVAIPEAPLTAINPLMTVTDTLPPNLSYVPGSGVPEPVVSGNTLTWEFPDGTTNEPVTIVFSATIDPAVVPGDLITNTATAQIDGYTRIATAQTRVQAGGFTSLRKQVDQSVVPYVDGTATNEWTVRLESHDSATQSFTDTIDVLPYNGDGRGTAFHGDYELAGPVDVSAMPPGTTVYYSTADPATIIDDPGDSSNGVPGDPTGSPIWDTDFDSGATAVRVVGPALPPAGVHEFVVTITTDGASAGDVYVNRAQARADNTALVMRTSSAFMFEAPVLVSPDEGGEHGPLATTGVEFDPEPWLSSAILIILIGIVAVLIARSAPQRRG